MASVSTVVYHPFPTSNHNAKDLIPFRCELYIILFLHQTTTASLCLTLLILLYIILFLHQTTTPSPRFSTTCRCISSFSYIKPQQSQHGPLPIAVVYHPFPTSNHNPSEPRPFQDRLYIILFLHQTTTKAQEQQERLKLYIILFLHQTTT